MPFSTYAANKDLDLWFGKQAYTVPSTIYFGLCTGVTDAGVITGEPVGNGYARVAIDNDDVATVWAAAANKQKINNNAAIQFPATTGAWGTLTVGFLSDASSGGNVLYYANLSAAITPALGVPPIVPKGSFVISRV